MSDTNKNEKFTFTYMDKKYKIISPKAKDYREAKKESIRIFNEALKDGAMLKSVLDRYLEAQGLWDESQDAAYTSLHNELNENENILKKGGINLSTARDMAIKIRTLRTKIQELGSIKAGFEEMTPEGQANNAKFDYLIYCCLVYDDTKARCFSSYSDYLDNAAQSLCDTAGTNLMSLMFGFQSSIDDFLPELKFLREYKFMDDEGRLTNRDGQFVNNDGDLVDVNGNLLDTDGNTVVFEKEEIEFKPFLDDEGKPLGEKPKIPSKKKTPSKSKVKTKPES